MLFLNGTRKKALVYVLSTILVVTIPGCSNSIPYGAGLTKFGDQSHIRLSCPTTSGWVAYVAQGTVTTNWLWFYTQHPVVYSKVLYTGTSDIDDGFIRFGNRTFRLRNQPHGFELTFYLKSELIPTQMDISWKVHGSNVLHRISISKESMLKLPTINVSY